MAEKSSMTQRRRGSFREVPRRAKLHTRDLSVRYPVVDRVLIEDLQALGLTREEIAQPLPTLGYPARGVYALYTGEKRPPKKGEWYLSGADVEAYRASNNLNIVYHIAKLVRD